MEKYYRPETFSINDIKTILTVQDGLGKKRINKLIYLLNKRIDKRYNIYNKQKDNKKMLKKYRKGMMK